METINSLASGAAKLVWGENNSEADKPTTTTETNTTNEDRKPLADRTVNPAADNNTKTTTETQGVEPISGKLGNTEKEPAATETETSGLDGFKAPITESSGVTSTHNNAFDTTETKSPGLDGSKGPITGSSGVTGTHKNVSSTTDTQSPVQDGVKAPITESSGVTSTHNNAFDTTETQSSGLDGFKAPIAESSGVTGSHNNVSGTTETTSTSKGASSEQPSTTGDHGGFKAAQADIRDPETSATTDPKVEAERKNVDDTGGLDDGANPAKADGPGPRPIDEVARERGGDAANIGGKKEGQDDDPEGLGGKSDKKGTGEQYVKTSGLKADGGDFDATKPGAGREADRLLEEKGIQTPAAAAAANKKATPQEASPSASHDTKTDKPSLKEKIKAKLHKN